MEFDIKDVKSWATRHDVKIGAEGYFCNRVSDLDDMEDTKLSKIESICNNQANCFSSTAFYGSFSFFLPLSAVKEDKTKNKYRPIKDAYELYKFLLPSTSLTRKDFSDKLLLNFSITYRKRDTRNFTTTELITSVEVAVIDSCHLTIINRRELEYWFDNYEIMNNKGEWVPFGMEEKEND